MFEKIKELWNKPSIGYIRFLVFQSLLLILTYWFCSMIPVAENETKSMSFMFYLTLAYLYNIIELWLIDKFILKTIDLIDELKKGNMSVAFVVGCIFISTAIILTKG